MKTLIKHSLIAATFALSVALILPQGAFAGPATTKDCKPPNCPATSTVLKRR